MLLLCAFCRRDLEARSSEGQRGTEATAPSGDADFVGIVAWAGELGYGVRAPQRASIEDESGPVPAGAGHDHADHDHADHDHADHGQHDHADPTEPESTETESTPATKTPGHFDSTADLPEKKRRFGK